MRRLTQRYNAWVRAQPRSAGIISGITAGLLLFAVTTAATNDFFWGVLSGISTAIATGLAMYSVGTWDRGW